MRIVSTVLLALLFVVLLPVSGGFAQTDTGPKKGFGDHVQDAEKYFFGMPDVDFERRYFKDGKNPHNNQWNGEDWHPEYWADAKGGVTEVIDGFYDAGIIVDQYEDDVPVLEVGKPFLQLSPPDQRRVIAFVDYAFKITETKPHGIFYVVYDDVKHAQELIGVYTVNGLQLQ